ncbi:transposase [Candidatus Peregrinibacteria bacterium]|nr:transposase [Candidatus Peregrinibacteria bacterium]
MTKYNPEIHHRRSIRLQGYDYSQNGAYFITICVQNRECVFGEIKNGEMFLNDAGKMVQLIWEEIPEFYRGIEIDAFQIMPNHIHGIIVIQHECSTVGAGPRACPEIEDARPKIIDTCPEDIRIYHGNIHACRDVVRVYREISDVHINEFGIFHDIIGKPQNIIGQSQNINGQPQNAIGQSQNITGQPQNAIGQSQNITGQRQGVAPTESKILSLPDIVHRFKTMTTKKYTDGVKNNNWQPFSGKLWQRNYHEHIIRDEISLEKIREYIINNPYNWDEDEMFFHE